MFEVEQDFFDILDDNYEGYIYTDEDIFNFSMMDVPLPSANNFYNRQIENQCN